MSKAKSVVITVILALAVAVAAFFAAVSFPVEKGIKRLNSIASNISLGADYTGYAYTTVYPEGVLTEKEYSELEDSDKSAAYTKVGSLYAENEKYSDIDQLKKTVASDAQKLNKRFGQKGYSSYSVAVEDGLSIKISVPTDFTRAAYNGYDDVSKSADLSVASVALSSMTAYGELTLRTSDTSISMTDDNGKTITYDLLKKGNDEWVDKATVSSNNSRTKTYSLTEESVAPIFKSITSRTVGTTSLITFNFTKEGVEKFKEITTRAASSSSKTIYFFVGDRQLINFSCESAVSEKSFSLQASDKLTAQNSAITLNSAVNGGALELNYQDIESIVTSSATGGENASLFAFISCVLVLAGLCVFYIVKFKKLGAVMSLISAAFALVELYALFLLSIQVTFAVILAAMLCLGLYAVSNGVLLTEIKRLTQTGRTMQASVKEGYKNVLMSVTDLHIVLVIVAILLATVGVGEVAACGLISVVGVVASYVLYWFTRFMWYATSSSTRDKFGFAGLKRAVEDDE